MSMNAIAFDTLKYAKMLSDGGVPNPDVHSESLSVIIAQNIYLKHEVDRMIEDALKRFDERTQQMSLELKTHMSEMRSEWRAEASEIRSEMRAETNAIRIEMRDMRLDLERKITRMSFNVVTILGGLYLFVGAITTFIHISFH